MRDGDQVLSLKASASTTWATATSRRRYADAIAAYKRSAGSAPAICAPSGTLSWLSKESRRKTRRSRSSKPGQGQEEARRPEEPRRSEEAGQEGRTRKQGTVQARQARAAKPPQGQDAGNPAAAQEEPAAQPRMTSARNERDRCRVLDSLEQSPKGPGEDARRLRARAPRAARPRIW